MNREQWIVPSTLDQHYPNVWKKALPFLKKRKGAFQRTGEHLTFCSHAVFLQIKNMFEILFRRKTMMGLASFKIAVRK